MLEQRAKFSKQRIAVLALWFGVLIGVRLLLGLVLANMWLGTIGAVAITFGIFYATLRFTSLQKYRDGINSSLAFWYRRKFFYITGAISMFLLGSILFLIEFGHSNYGDRLITVDMTKEEFEDALVMFGAADQMSKNLADTLEKHSALEIIAITLASADKNLDGYYSKIVSYMFAEDIEIMIFLILFRSRREIFATPRVRPLAQIERNAGS